MCTNGNEGMAMTYDTFGCIGAGEAYESVANHLFEWSTYKWSMDVFILRVTKKQPAHKV